MSVTLHLGDCLEYMRGVDSQSIDFGFADPPYNVGKDYGTYKDNLSYAEYISWCELWSIEIKRICKTVAIYPPKKHMLEFWNMFPENYQIICGWSPEGAIRSGFVHQYIPLLVPQNPVKRTKDLWYNPQVPGLGYFYRENKTGHPGQTSTDITNRIITSFTNPGDTVFDPFMGSGTTGICSIKLGRSFIGCEIDPKWFEYARIGIELAQAQPLLFEAV